ncbi:MAG TPA: acetate--CoA ligase family protein [bacterium]|nr:acetate--CoA ligase family protein [bacterium]
MGKADEMIESWEKLFNPRSVAVVGASNAPGKWGFIIPMNLQIGGYEGGLFMINPKEKSVHGLPTFKKLNDVKEPIDLVMVTVPAKIVGDVIEQCAEIGTTNVVVISSGFSEIGAEGREMEAKLAAQAKKHGIRLIGPNTMGICSPPTNLFGLGSFNHPPAGSVAFISQSGNLGVQLLGWAARAGLGISRFIGSGNEAVVTCDQILEYYGVDPETRVIIMYLEGIDNGQRFLEVARRVTPVKPIIALKMGATEEGAKAASSHSGAVSSPHRVYQAMVKQAGIIEAASTQEMVNLARTFGHLPIPKGRRVGIMTMGGGWGVVTTEHCAKAGLKLPPPSPSTIEAVNQVLPEFWSHGNPVDLVGSIHRSAHYAVLEAMVRDPNFDSIITLGSLTGMQFAREQNRVRRVLRIARNLIARHKWNLWRFDLALIRGVRTSLQQSRRKKRAHSGRGRSSGLDFREAREWSDEVFADEVKLLMRGSGKPIVPVPFEPATVSDIFKKLGLVAFGIPEEAVVAISKLTDYHSFLERIQVEQERDDMVAPMDDTAVAISNTLKHRSRVLSESESKDILTHFGIAVTRDLKAANEDDAVAAAKDIGFPVVLKVDSPDIPHKSDAGCVVLNVRDEDGVRKAFKQVTENARAFAKAARVDGAIVSEMVAGGTEVLVGTSTDRHYGQTIVFGLGGVFIEALDDVSLRILPIGLPDAEAMVGEIKGIKVLQGIRGQKRRDVAALAETIRRIGDLAWSLRDRIVELDVNPLVVFEDGKGVKALDALIVLNDKTAP